MGSRASTPSCRRAITVEDYRQAPREGDPLNLFDVAPLADGAAALVLTRREALPAGSGRPQVRVAGSSVATAATALHDQPDMLGLSAAESWPGGRASRPAWNPTG